MDINLKEALFMHNQTTNNTKIIVSAIEDGRWEDPEFLAQMEEQAELYQTQFIDYPEYWNC